MKVPWNLRWCDIQLIFHAWLIGLLTRRLYWLQGLAALLGPQMADLSPTSEQWWNVTVDAAREWCEHQLLSRMHVLPINLLQRPRWCNIVWSRVERRASSLLMAAIPDQLRERSGGEQVGISPWHLVKGYAAVSTWWTSWTISHFVLVGVTNGGNYGVFGDLNFEKVVELEKTRWRAEGWIAWPNNSGLWRSAFCKGCQIWVSGCRWWEIPSWSTRFPRMNRCRDLWTSVCRVGASWTLDQEEGAASGSAEIEEARRSTEAGWIRAERRIINRTFWRRKEEMSFLSHRRR